MPRPTSHAYVTAMGSAPLTTKTRSIAAIVAETATDAVRGLPSSADVAPSFRGNTPVRVSMAKLRSPLVAN